MKVWLNEHKKVSAVILALLFIAILFWQSLSSQIAQAVQGSLLEKANQQITGKLQVGSVDFSLLGSVRLREVVLYDQKGELLLKSPSIKISYRWSDLFNRSLGLNQIEAVTFDGADIWLVDKGARFNWDGLLRAETPDNTSFRGKIAFDSCRVHFSGDLFAKTLENMDGSVDFAKQPDLSVNLSAKLEQTPLTIAGQWGKGRPGEIRVQANQLDMVKLGFSFGEGAETRLEKGRFDKLQLTVKTDAKGVQQINAQGEFTGLATGGKMIISDGRGKFSGSQDEIKFTDLAMRVSGQQALGQGSFRWKDGKGNVDFTMELPDVDPEALVSGLTVQRPLAIQIKAAGPVAQPDITGTFQAQQFSFTGMVITGVSGQFRYSGERVLLEYVSGAANGGKIAATGEIRVSGQTYELDVEGQGMESSRLTDKDVEGPLDFSGHTSGKGQDAMTRGNFAIHKGKAYGIPFDRMTGEFVKKGETTDISEIAVQTALGTFYPEQLSREALERINRKELPVTKEDAKKAVTDKIIQRIFR